MPSARITGLFGTQTIPPDMRSSHRAVLLLQHEHARPRLGRGERGDHAATTGTDDDDVDGGVPRRHVTPLALPATAQPESSLQDPLTIATTPK